MVQTAAPQARLPAGPRGMSVHDAKEAEAAVIDALVILFSAGMCLFIAWRAVRLDAQLPWFGDAGRDATPGPPDPAAAQGWRARRRDRR